MQCCRWKAIKHLLWVHVSSLQFRDLHTSKHSSRADENSPQDTAYPAFLEKFGTPAPNGKLQIPASWQNGITGAKNVGEIVGLQVG